jgi:hypothetical protein
MEEQRQRMALKDGAEKKGSKHSPHVTEHEFT